MFTIGDPNAAHVSVVTTTSFLGLVVRFLVVFCWGPEGSTEASAELVSTHKEVRWLWNPWALERSLEDAVAAWNVAVQAAKLGRDGRFFSGA